MYLAFADSAIFQRRSLRIVERINRNQLSGMVEKIDLEIQVPSGFPEKYRESSIRSAELCAVKKHLENPPQFDITTKQIDLQANV